MYVLWRLIVKEFQQLARDRRILPLIFIAPTIQILAFGYAVNMDVTDVPLAVVDRDRTPASRELRDRFLGSRYFTLVAVEEGLDDVDRHLVTDRAMLALVIGAGYGEAVASGRSPEVQVLADGSNSAIAMIAMGYATGIVSQTGEELVGRSLQRMAAAAAGQAPDNTVRSRGGEGSSPSIPTAASATPRAGPARIELVPRVWYNPELKSRWFYVPAVLAMVLMSLTMILSSMGVVREKEIGTMEQVMVTPIASWQLIVGKLFPFALIGLVDVFLVTALAVWWFQVPLQGSLALLVALTMLFILNTLGLGLLTSTLVRTQKQAMMISGLGIMTPMIYLSGLIFPIENMPEAVQLTTYAIPLRYYATIIRGIFLKGSGLAVLWPQAAALAAMGVGFLALASLRFRKRLD